MPSKEPALRRAGHEGLCSCCLVSRGWGINARTKWDSPNFSATLHRAIHTKKGHTTKKLGRGPSFLAMRIFPVSYVTGPILFSTPHLPGGHVGRRSGPRDDVQPLERDRLAGALVPPKLFRLVVE